MTLHSSFLGPHEGYVSIPLVILQCHCLLEIAMNETTGHHRWIHVRSTQNDRGDFLLYY
jgi:hypothetical protein